MSKSSDLKEKRKSSASTWKKGRGVSLSPPDFDVEELPKLPKTHRQEYKEMYNSFNRITITPSRMAYIKKMAKEYAKSFQHLSHKELKAHTSQIEKENGNLDQFVRELIHEEYRRNMTEEFEKILIEHSMREKETNDDFFRFGLQLQELRSQYDNTVMRTQRKSQKAKTLKLAKKEKPLIEKLREKHQLLMKRLEYAYQIHLEYKDLIQRIYDNDAYYLGNSDISSAVSSADELTTDDDV